MFYGRGVDFGCHFRGLTYGVFGRVGRGGFRKGLNDRDFCFFDIRFGTVKEGYQVVLWNRGH